VQFEGPPPRRLRRSTDGRVERTIVAIGLLAAIGWWPFMIVWWMQHGWPAYPETYFVGLVVFPAAIFGAGKLLATGVRALRGRFRR
jgi:hypothetical protein